MYWLDLALLCGAAVLGTSSNTLAAWILWNGARPTRKHPLIQPQAGHFLLLQRAINASDLLIVLWYVPSQWVLRYLHGRWYAGTALCKTSAFLNTFVFHLSSNVIACIALDRAYIVHNVTKLRNSTLGRVRGNHNHLVRRMLACACALAAAASAPQWFLHVVVRPTHVVRAAQFCVNYWVASALQRATSGTNGTSEWLDLAAWEQPYYIIHLALMFWMPLSIVVSSYTYIIATLRRRHAGRDKKRGWSHTDSRAFRISTMLMISYTMCWAPYNVLALFEASEQWPQALHVLQYANIFTSVINPLIYYRSAGRRSSSNSSVDSRSLFKGTITNN